MYETCEIMVGRRWRGYHKTKIIAFSFLLAYACILWGKSRSLTAQLRSRQSTLNILDQMRQYAEKYCSSEKGDRQSDTTTTRVGKTINRELGKETNGTVSAYVTFILIGPTLKCLNAKFSWLRQRYTTAKFLLALDVAYTFQNPLLETNNALIYKFLGGFNRRADALNRAIRQVDTKYFFILDHFVELTLMADNYVEQLVSHIPGFDILSSAKINARNELSIPCHHLKLDQWSLFETYEYKTSGTVLKCDSTSLYFLGRTEAFRDFSEQDLFDKSLPEKWLQDFFINFKDVVNVGVIPTLQLYLSIPAAECYYSPPQVMSSSGDKNVLLPFVRKYQVFSFISEARLDNICKSNDSVMCNAGYLQKEMSIGGFSVTGLTTFPFVIESLQESLHFADSLLKMFNLDYVFEGGTSLGLIKARDVLPWDHGDIDTFVYARRRQVINMVLKTHRANSYHYLLRHTGFHIDIDMSGSTIVFLSARVKPQDVIYIRRHDKVFPLKREIFKFLRESYGSMYFEKRMKYTNQRNVCKVPGHHACMLDCRWDGCGSM